MKKALSSVLAALLAVFSAGTRPYAAWAQAVSAGVAATPSSSAGASGAAGAAVGRSGPALAPLPGFGGIGLASSLGPATLRPHEAGHSGASAPLAPLSGPSVAIPKPASAASPARAFAPAAMSAGLAEISRAAPGAIASVASSGGGAVSVGLPAAKTAAVRSLGFAAALGRKMGTKERRLGLSRVFDGSGPGGTGAASGRAVPGAFRPAGNLIRPAGETGPEADPDGLRSTGLDPPVLRGTLDAGAYRVPASIRVRRAVFLGAHYAFLSAGLALVVAGAGLVPVAMSAGVLAAKGLWNALTAEEGGPAMNGARELDGKTIGDLRAALLKMREGSPLDRESEALVEDHSGALTEYLEWVEASVEGLVARMGVDPYRAPRTWFDEYSSNLSYAASLGKALDKSSNIYIGMGFMLRPMRQAVGVLAHELGHLFFGDKGWLRDRFRMSGTGWETFGAGMKAAFGISLGSGLFSAVFAALHLAAPPLPLLTAGVLLGSALAVSAAGFLFGLAATRQEEFRADHFSAWLTRPGWLASYLREEGAGREEEHGFLAGLFSTHPSFASRAARLGAMPDRAAVGEGPILPASRSEYALNGAVEVLIRGLAPEAAGALEAALGDRYGVEVHFDENAPEIGPDAVVRLHPKGAVLLTEGSGADERALVSAVLAEAGHLDNPHEARHAGAPPRQTAPGARVLSSRVRPHDIFSWARRSPTARRLMGVLAANPIPVSWDESLGPDGPRGAFVGYDSGRPEIVVNPHVFWKASPRALMSVLAHEVFHYEVYLEMRRIGIDWLALGGIEFERLAHSIGARVWAELGAGPGDDFAGEFRPQGYESGFRRWARLGRGAHLEFLKTHGYGGFMSLEQLSALDPEAIGMMTGSEDEPAEIAAKLAALRRFHRRKARTETLWKIPHLFHLGRARLREALGPSHAAGRPDNPHEARHSGAPPR